MPLVKPGLWSVNPADIDPSWLWFWQYAGHAAVYNEGAGAPWDYATGHAASTVTSIEWLPTSLGIGAKRGSTSDRLIWSARDDFQLLGDVNWSAGIVLDVSTTAGGLIVARDDTDDGFWEFRLNSTTDISLDWRVSGGGQSADWTVPTVTQSIHSFFVSRRVGGVYELWIDGVSQGTQTNTTAPATSRAHDLEIGRRGNNSASVLGTYLASYVLKGLALNNGLVRQLVQDPFGMFRQALFVTDVAVVATPFDLIAKKTGIDPDPPLRIFSSYLIRSEVVVLPPVKLIPLHTGTEVEIPRPPQTVFIRPEVVVVPPAEELPEILHTGTPVEVPAPSRTILIRPEVINPLTALPPDHLVHLTGTASEIAPPPVTVFTRPDVIPLPAEELPVVYHTGTAIEIPPPSETILLRPDVILPLTALPPDHLLLRTGTAPIIPLPPITQYVPTEFLPIVPTAAQPGSETGRSSGTLAADRGIDLGTQTTGQSPVSAKTGKSPSSL